MATLTRKKADQMMDIAILYLNLGGEEPLDMDKLTDFAIDNGHWSKKNIAEYRRQLCKREFAQAFREQYHTDPQGRHVRTMHPLIKHVDSKQKTFWGDMRKMDETDMVDAFQRRRAQIVGDCTQLKIDVDSWNENNTVGGDYQLLLNFADDVAERTQPTIYEPRAQEPKIIPLPKGTYAKKVARTKPK